MKEKPLEIHLQKDQLQQKYLQLTLRLFVNTRSGSLMPKEGFALTQTV